MRAPINKEEVEAINKLVLLAVEMTNEELSYIEGATKVLSLFNIHELVNRKELDVFSVIHSETDHMPQKEQRSLWSQQSLDKLEPELIKAEKWAKSIASETCHDIIKKHGTANK